MKFSIKNGSVTLNGNTILEEINFEISEGEHVAIVGKNGAGKTTLLNAIIDNELLDAGISEEKFEINKIGEFKIGYLKQIDFDDESITLLDEIKKSFKDIINMEIRLEYLSKRLHEGEKYIKEYTDLQESYKYLNGYGYKKEYEIMLNKFGFTEEDKGKKISEFSGGQKTKIAFVKLLLSKPDLLILDEPTNHLDITTIEWLEEYLKNYKKSIIIVSHDRMFINNIANIIYDIDYGKVVKYNGNYSFYEKQKRENYNKLMKDYEFQQKEIKRLMSIYERFRNKPSKAKMALSKLHQVEKMDLIDMPNSIDMKSFKTNLDNMEESVKNVIIASDLEIGYDKVLAKLNLNIKRGKKIGVIGKNGCGKSTLLKTLNGSIDPISGNISYGLKVTPGYFDQNLLMINENNTILTEFMEYLPELNDNQARSALGSFLFKGDDVLKRVSVLSGGEKVRLQLCKILYKKPNLLILDEPTNHMDIAGKEYFESLLEDYKGTIIFVSHDRYFVEKIAEQLIVFDENGATFYEYGYDSFKNNEKVSEVKKAKKEETKEKDNKVNLYDLKKELNKLENEMIKKETKIKVLESEQFNSDIYTDYKKINDIKEKIERLNQELLELNKKWEELTDTIVNNKKDEI